MKFRRCQARDINKGRDKLTGTELVDELKAELERIYQDYMLINKNGVLQAVKIFTQFLPQPEGITFSNKKSGLKNYSEYDYELNFPCVIIHHDGITDNEERRLDLCSHKVRLIFGIYDGAAECQGWRDIMSMYERVKMEFLIKRVIACKFRLLMPMNFNLIEEDTWPVYFGQLNLTYETGRASMPADFVHKREIRI